MRWGLLFVLASGCGFTSSVTPTDGQVIDMGSDTPDMMLVQRVVGAKGEWRFNEGSGSSILDHMPAPMGYGPMHLTIETPSAVTWVFGGLRLDSRVTIDSVANPHVGNSIATTHEFTIDAWVATANVTQGLDPPDPAPDHATIVNVSGSIVSFSALIGQIGTTWVGRARSSTTGGDARPEISSNVGMAEANKVIHLALVANSTERILYVDGMPFMSTPTGVGTVDWDSSYKIRVGDAISYDRQWQGTMYFLAIYDRALTPAEVRQNHDATYMCSEC